MLEKLVVHPQTALQLTAFASEPSHAIALIGADGMGKGTLAFAGAAHILQITPEAAHQHHTVHHIEADEKGTIPIESVRSLQKFVRLKTTGTRTIRRAIIVEHADGLTTEAQNAFLKLLEEPPADTIIILTVSNVRALLPTIRSRVQTVTVHAPDKAALATFFEQDYPATSVTQAYFLSGGLPGLMQALLAGDQSHPLMQSVVQAKAILQQTTFERLASLDVLAKQKETAARVCEALSRIAQAGLDQAATKTDEARIKQWHRILKAVADAQDNLRKSANTKLTLTHLMLQL